MRAPLRRRTLRPAAARGASRAGRGGRAMTLRHRAVDVLDTSECLLEPLERSVCRRAIEEQPRLELQNRLVETGGDRPQALGEELLLEEDCAVGMLDAQSDHEAGLAHLGEVGLSCADLGQGGEPFDQAGNGRLRLRPRRDLENLLRQPPTRSLIIVAAIGYIPPESPFPVTRTSG